MKSISARLLLLLLLISPIHAQPADSGVDGSKLSPNVNGNWMVGYQDAVLGFVEGNAVIDRNNVTVNLFHPVDGSVHTLHSISVEWLSKTRMRVRLHGQSPHGEKVEKPDIADMVKLEVAPQRDNVEIKSGPFEDTIPVKLALEAWGDYVDLELEYNDDTFTGQWFYVADPQTQRNANGFGRVGNFKIDELEGRQYASQSGVEVWERKRTRILASCVIGDQMHYDHDIYDFPYPWAENNESPYGHNRSIFVVGENLPKNYADPAEFESGDPQHIRYRTNVYDDQKSIAYNKPFFDKAWQSLLAKYDESVHDDLLSKQAIIVTAYMDEGVIPGPQHFKLNGAPANWTLQFGDNLGTLSFVRKVTDGQEYETLTDVLRPSVIYLQVYTKHKMPLDEIPLILGLKDALLDLDETTGELKFIPTPQVAPSDESIRESSNTAESDASESATAASEASDDASASEEPTNHTIVVKKVSHPVTMSSRKPPKAGQFYRSEPIVLIGANDPAPKDIRLHIRVNEDDTLNAMIAREGLLKIDPAVTTVKVRHIPADMGSTWLEALIKAANCHDDVEPVELRQKTAHRVGSISNLIVSELSIARNYVTLGDHAAMLLLREEFIKASQEQLDFLNGIQGQAMLWTWANMIRPQMSDRNSAFHHVTVTAPNGDPLYFSAIWQIDWISEYFDITPRRAREWANRAVAEGMENLKAQISQAMSDARGIDTCELEDLLELTGYGFDAMVDRVKQRLVKIERVGDPARTQWVPDSPAHAAVSSLHQLADAVQAQEEYSKLDTAFAITCAALVAIPIASGGSVAGTAIAYGIDLADLGITLATQVPEYIEDKERVAFARNAMMVLGSDRLAEAKAREMSAMELGLSVLGAGVGGVAGRAQFLDSIRNIPIRQLRREGARLAKQVQGGGLDALKQLSPEDQAKYMAYIADIKQISRNAHTGRLGLTWSQNRALSRFEKLQKQAQELAAATARNTDEVTSGATNTARATNSAADTANSTADATSTVARDARHQLDGMRYEDLPAVSRADDVPPTTVARRTEDAMEQPGMADALNRASRDSELPTNPRQPDMPANPARNTQPDTPDMPRRPAVTDAPDAPRRTAETDSPEMPGRNNTADTPANPTRTSEANAPTRTTNNTPATPRQPVNSPPSTPRRTASNTARTDVNKTRRFDDGFDNNIPPAIPRRAVDPDMPTTPRRTASDNTPSDVNKTRRFDDGFDDNIPPATPATARRSTTSNAPAQPTRNTTAQPPANTRTANSTLPPTPRRTPEDLLPPAPRPSRADTPPVTNRSRTATNETPTDINKTRRFEDGFDDNIPPAPPLTKADLDPPRAADVDPSVRRPVTQKQADEMAMRLNSRLDASKNSMSRLEDQAKNGNLSVSPKIKRALQDRIDNLSQRKAILDDVLEGLKNGKHHDLSDADMRWLTGRDVDLSPAQRAALKNTLMTDFGGSWKAATDNLMGSPTDKILLQKLGTLRKHEVDKLLDDIMRRIEAKTGQKLEAQAFGSTTLTSDYDLSIKGPGAERVITEFNKRYRKLYGGRESGTVFDTNVYTDPVYTFIPPDSALAKALGPKGADDVQQFMYEHMANAKYMTPGQWQKHVEQVLNATPGRHKGAIKRLLEEVEAREFASRAAINKRMNELGLDPSDTNSRLRAQNDLYGQTLTRIDELRQYQNGLDLLADGKPASFKIPRKDQSSAFASNLRRYNELISDTNPATKAASQAEAKELLSRMRTSLSGNLRNNQGAALYYASEAYQTEGTIKHVVGELQKDKRVIDPDILKSPLAEDPPLTRGQYINSFNENRGNLFKELNDKGVLDDAGRFRRDLSKVDDQGNIVPLTEAELYKIAKKSAMKTSKYFVRQLDAAHRAGVDLKSILGEDLTRVIDQTVTLEKVRNDGDAFALALKKLKITPEQFVNRAMEASDLLTSATHRFSPVRSVGDDLTRHFDQLDDDLAEFRRFNRPADGSDARPRRLSRSELRHRLDDNPTMRFNDRFDENIPSASRADLPRTTRMNDDFDANLPTANRADLPRTTRVNDGFDESLPAARTELPRTTRIKDGFDDNLPTASRTDLPTTKRIKDGFDENLPGSSRTELPSATKRFDDVLPTPSRTLPDGTKRFDDVLPNPRTPVARELPTPAGRMPDVDDGLTPRVSTQLDPNVPIRVGNDPKAPVFGDFGAGPAPLPTPRLDPQPVPGGFGFNPAARNNPFEVPTPAAPKPADFGFAPSAPKAKPIELPKSFNQAAQPTPLPARTYSTGDVFKTADGKTLTVGKSIGEGAYSHVFAIKERPGEVIKFLKIEAAEKAGRDAIEMVHDAKRISELLEARGVRQMKVTEINPDPANPFVIVQKLPDEGKLVDHKDLYNAAEAGKRQEMIEAGKWSDQHEEAVLDLYAEMARKNIVWYDGHLDNVYFIPVKMPDGKTKLKAGVIDHDMIGDWDSLSPAMREKINDLTLKNRNENMASLKTHGLLYDYGSAQEFMTKMLEFKRFINYDYHAHEFESLIMNLENVRSYFKVEDYLGPGAKTQSYRLPTREYRPAA